MYVIVFVCAVTFPIVFVSISPTPENLGFIMAVGFLAACFITGNILFLWKVHLIIQKAEVNDKFEVVRSSENSVSYNPIKSIRKALNSRKSASSRVGDDSQRAKDNASNSRRERRASAFDNESASSPKNQPVKKDADAKGKLHHLRYSERMDLNSLHEDVKSTRGPQQEDQYGNAKYIAAIPNVAEEKPLFMDKGSAQA